MTDMKCPKCGGMMEAGYIDEYDNNWGASAWKDGSPRLGLSGVLKVFTGRPRRILITAYRCDGCGYLEFFAHEDRKEKFKRG